MGSTTFVNLLAGGTYEVAVSGGATWLVLSYGDAQVCKGGVTLQFAQPSGAKWALTPGPGAFYQ